MSESKQKWIESVETVCSFHRECLRQAAAEGSKWTLSDTSRALNKSIGRICEKLMLGEGLKTHRKQLEKFINETDAVKFMRKKKKERLMM